MRKVCPMHRRNEAGMGGFTLIELLVVIAIVAVLAGLLSSVAFGIFKKKDQTAGLSQMRQVGIGFLLFAQDHDFELPGRTREESVDRWPRALAKYVQDLRVYAAPGDSENWIARGVEPLDNATNNTSYIMNGYNDLGAFEDDSVVVRVNQIDRPGAVLLLGTPKTGSRHFYMDMLEGPNGNHVDVLNLQAYDGGSNYLFADGSARFIAAADYDPRMWLVNPEFALPQ